MSSIKKMKRLNSFRQGEERIGFIQGNAVVKPNWAKRILTMHKQMYFRLV